MSKQFGRIFLWHVLRNVRRHRVLALLNVLSVALGIAVYLAIQIANHSANRSFAAGIDLVAGKAHLEVRGDVDETLWPKIASQPGVRAVTGLLEGVVTLPDLPGEYLHVIGVDLFSGEAFRTFSLTDAATGREPGFERWLGRPGAIAVTEKFARLQDWKIGQKIRVQVQSETQELEIVALLSGADSPSETQPRFAVMDIGWMQELFGRTGHLSTLQILAEDPRHASEVAARVQAILPTDLHVEPPRQRSAQVENMLGAFQLNLTALSMVSLLVGVFLIYNTISASVARRRREIGILRSIGATQGEVRALFLGEACVFGACGIFLGSIGGVLLAQMLTGTVAKTISSLYVLVSIDRNWLNPWQFLTAALCCFAAVLAGAWLPASAAAKIDPIAALSLGSPAEESAGKLWRWTAWGGALLLCGLAASSLALTTGPAAWSFFAAFFVLSGFAMFAPGVTQISSALAARGWRLGLMWRLSADQVRRSLHRHGVTVAALAAAIAMTVGLTVMIFSFRRSVQAWVERGIVADLFVAPSANETIGLSAEIPAAAVNWWKTQPGVSGVDTFQEKTVRASLRERAFEPVLLAIVDGQYRKNLSFVGGDDVQKMARVANENCVAITEPLARRFHLHDGEVLAVETPRGTKEFTIAGTYSDFTRDQGMMLMAGKNYASFWPDARAESLAVYLQPGADGEVLAEKFRAIFSRHGEFQTYANRSLRTRIFAIFDQTFAVTYILRTVAVFVALAGIFLSVTTLATERERDLGALRAIGATRGQVQALLMVEAGMIGFVATFLGLAAGAVLAMTLTWVVNPAFFGWSIALQFPWSALAAMPLWIVPTAFLAAWYPAWRAGQIDISQALREE